MRSKWKGVLLSNVLSYDGLRGFLNGKQLALMLFNWRVDKLRGLFYVESVVWLEQFVLIGGNLLDVGLDRSNIWDKARVFYYQDLEVPKRMSIYNGKVLFSIALNEMKHGARLGEFVMTKGRKVQRKSDHRKRSVMIKKNNKNIKKK